MSLVLVNVLLAVGVVAMLLVALVVLRRLRKQAIMIALRYTEWALGPFLPVINSHFPDQTSYDEYVGHLMGTTIRRRAERIVAIVRLLNVVSTTLALVPLGFAVYNIVTDNQTQALTFNLVSLATVVVTKGGLFLLTSTLLPALKAVPGALAGAAATRWYNKWRNKQEREKEHSS